jgi:hypothetical protein
LISKRFAKKIKAENKRNQRSERCIEFEKFSLYKNITKSMRSYKSPNSRPSSPWHYEESESEASVMGSYFATAVTAVALGHADVLLKKKTPTRKLYYEEKLFNPPIENSHIKAGFDAHVMEETLHWQHAAITIPKAFRDTQIQPRHRMDNGPKKPEEFPHIFESPITVQDHSGEYRPFDRIIKVLDKPNLENLQVSLFN